jgi:hypothetical protein
MKRFCDLSKDWKGCSAPPTTGCSLKRKHAFSLQMFLLRHTPVVGQGAIADDPINLGLQESET